MTVLEIFAEFPDWTISRAERDMWSATWRSADGRDLHYIVNASAEDLLKKLRQIRDENA